MCNAAFGKSVDQVRNHRDIIVTTDKKRCQLVSEPNYHTTKKFSEDLIAIEMKKTLVKLLCMNFGMIILNQSMIII